VQFLPSQAGADGTGATVRQEITEAVEAAVAADEWLQEHPLRWEWGWSSPPAEIAADQPVVTMALQAGADVGRPGRVAGMNSWHDAASFTLYGGTPSISFGPGDVHQAHTVDESIEVEQLRDYVAAMCLLMTRFCGLRD
jgi:acetylornithine deacetylase